MALTQIVNHMQMYLTHYSWFDEPDGDLPWELYFNSQGLPDVTLELVPPLGARWFHRHSGHLVEGTESWKPLSYRIAPVTITPIVPPAALAGLQKLVHTLSGRNITAADVTVVMAAVGGYLPSSVPVTAKRFGSHFEVTKDIKWRVQIRLAFAYEPLHLAVLSDYVKNGEAATYLGLTVPPGVNPNDHLAYEWGGLMTLSTSNSYVRPCSSEPPPFAAPFPSGSPVISFVGQPVDNLGRYTLVGSFQAPNYIASPTATVPDILGKLFGSNVLTDCELAIEESGIVTVI